MEKNGRQYLQSYLCIVSINLLQEDYILNVCPVIIFKPSLL